MAKGTISGSTSNQYIDSKIEWSSTPNNTANTSKVTAALYYRRNNTGYETKGTGTFSITINGSKTSVTKHLTIGTDWVLAVEATTTISHNTDGSKSISISASGSITGTSLSSTACSGTAQLDTIPRSTSIDYLACSTKYFTGNITYKYTPKSAGYYTRCSITVNVGGTHTTVKTVNIGQQTATQKTATVTLSSSELSTIYNKLPSTTSGVLRYTLRTYSDSGYSSQIGDAVYKEITLYIPNTADTRPTVSATLSPVSSLASPFNTIYVQGYSKVKATPSTAGKYGATIAQINVEVDGKSCSGYTSDYLKRSGSISVKITAKDSRGFTNTSTQSIDVVQYSEPRVVPANGNAAIVCARCDSNGNISDSGTYLKIKARRRYSTCTSGGVQYNKCGLRYRYKKASDSSFSAWITLLNATDLSTEEVNSSPLLGTLSTTESYVVHVDAVDTFGKHAYANFDIPTDKVYMERDGSRRSIAFGKYVERDNAVEIAEDIDLYYKGDRAENLFFSLRGNTEIPSDADLNNYKKPSVYAIATDDAAKVIGNMPPSKRAGILVVYAGTGQEYVDGGAWKYVVQEYKSVLPSVPTYKRLLQSDGGGVWEYGAWTMEKGLDTGWVDLGLSSSVTKSTANYTRSGHGCYYRVINNNHVYIAFNCAFTHSGSDITINSSMIPSEYRPKANAYAMCFTSGYGIAQVLVGTEGKVVVKHVKDASSITWMDGYIDYWL